MAQVFKSQYGQKGCIVSDQCPTLAIDQRLRTVHVSTPDTEVAGMVREAVQVQRGTSIRNFQAWTDKREREAVRYAVWRHRENRAEYGWVMGGAR